MKVYMVTAGQYSDYSVLGIYSTMEKAEHARDLMNADNDIDEHEMDWLPDHPKGLRYFGLKMDVDGNTDGIYRQDFRGTLLEDFSVNWCPWGKSKQAIFKCWAKDEKHAVNIANELRVQLIASGEWTTDWNVWLNRQKGKA